MEASIDTALVRDRLGELLADAAATLAAAGIETARLDAEVLLAAACGLERSALYLRRLADLPAQALPRFRALLERRRAREPLQYIVGRQEFWSLDFRVTPDVLVPRPETELLVEAARARVSGRAALCDLGTGSGCLAVALARELPGAEIWALDISSPALAVAADNARRHEVAARVHFVESDLFAAVRGRRFDVIVCNPPYVCSAALSGLQPELAWEPRRALDGGARGLDVVSRVLSAAPAHLTPGGWLLMEIGAGQEREVTALASQAGFGTIAVQPDYAGLPRVLVARR